MNKTNIIIIALFVGSLLISFLYSADVVVYPRTTGYPYPCPIPKTGQTNSYATGDDGALRLGVAWPNPRFKVGTSGDATNCVTDNLTGLMWARDASNTVVKTTWGAAVTNCNALDYGGYTDWRLPNRFEMQSLCVPQFAYPCIPNTVGTSKCTQNDPFCNVIGGNIGYWMSSVDPDDPNVTASYFALGYGVSTRDDKVSVHCVWPVRGP